MYCQEDGPALVEPFAVPTIYYDGLTSLGVINGMEHYAMWIEQPGIEQFGLERVMVARIIISEANLMRALRAVQNSIAGRKEQMGKDAH